MAAIEKIAELRELCEKYTLEDRERIGRYTDAALAGDIYNGAGPDSWIPLARDILTALMSLFEPQVLIHDTQFYESDGTFETFRLTVEIWERNCRKIFDTEYPLFTWRMLKRDYRSKRAYWYGILQAGIIGVSGTPAYNAWKGAFEKRAGLAK